MGSVTAFPCKWWRDSFALLSIEISVSVLYPECRHLHPRELLVDEVASFGGRLGLFEEAFKQGRVGAFDHPEARLVAHVVSDFGFWWSIVEVEWRLSFRDAIRIEPVQRPDSGFDCEFLLRCALGHVVAMRDAMAVGNYQRWTMVSLGFAKRLDRLQHLRAKSNACDVHVTVHISQKTKVFLSYSLSGGSKLSRCAKWRRLGLLPAGV